jgi:hypothetical protein
MESCETKFLHETAQNPTCQFKNTQLHFTSIEIKRCMAVNATSSKKEF